MGNWEANDLVVLSIGTGIFNVHPAEKHQPFWISLANYFLQSSTDSENQHRQALLLCKQAGIPYHRLNVSWDSHVAMDEHHPEILQRLRTTECATAYHSYTHRLGDGRTGTLEEQVHNFAHVVDDLLGCTTCT